MRISNRHGAKMALTSLIIFTILSLKYSIDDVSRKTANKFDTAMDNNRMIRNVQIDKWILVDGSGLSNQRGDNIEEVAGWRILLFGFEREISCNHCLSVKDFSDIRGHLPSIPVSNLKMAVYMFVISQGAKWIYFTTHSENLQEQLQGFHLNERSKGLFYEGRKTFDPDHHFGIKDMSIDHTIRNQHSQCTLGDFLNPRIQVKWKPPNHLIGNSPFDIENVACRQPKISVPAKYYPVSGLSGSLIERDSFWALGSLIKDSPYWKLWWVSLMEHLNDVIGIFPPSCKRGLNLPTSDEAGKHHGNIAQAIKCKPETPFFPCGIHVAAKLKEHGKFNVTDVELIQNWFDALTTINYKVPRVGIRANNTFLLGPLHQVLFEQTCKTHPQHSDMENPFNGMCGTNLTKMSPKSPPISDILLIVIFNQPHYYSNIVYLDYLYRQYFTNIVYCGMNMALFMKFQRLYLKPLTFLQVNEEFKGYFGYMCAATAMGMGFKVKGYLQISEDVLLNMWNIKSLPRDKIWFQSEIRKGSLSENNVPNLETGSGNWYNWANPYWGVKKLRLLWEHFAKSVKLSATMRKEASFLLQLTKSYGNIGGAFYGASDIFYVPEKYSEKFRYFSNLFLQKNIFLEIAIPTILCGLDDVKNFVKLQGTYLWLQNRNLQELKKKYSVGHHFIHPMKLRTVVGKRAAGKFVCTKYLPFVLQNR